MQKKFEEWDTENASWRNRQFVKPSNFSEHAGWELVQGTRRNLFHSKCFAVIPTRTEPSNEMPVKLMQSVKERCPWCAQKLVHLIEVDTSSEGFGFLGGMSRVVSVLTCHACTLFTTVYGCLCADGSTRWAECNSRPNDLPEDMDGWPTSPWRRTSFTLRPRRAFEAANWCLGLVTTQIGGMPSWVQHPDYPKCPSCKRTMLNVGQVDNGAFRGFEGVYYAFFCADCGMTATTYQQT